MANLAMVASIDQDRPRVRTLILRDVDGGYALFFNATSPKQQQLMSSATVELALYWPSLQVQYRLRAHTRPLDADTIARFWPLRPVGAKTIDAVYESGMRQSTVVSGRQELLERFAAVSVPTTTPKTATGVFLDIYEIDRLHLNDRDPPHDRQRFRLVDDVWLHEVLVP